MNISKNNSAPCLWVSGQENSLRIKAWGVLSPYTLCTIFILDPYPEGAHGHGLLAELELGASPRNDQAPSAPTLLLSSLGVCKPQREGAVSQAKSRTLSPWQPVPGPDRYKAVWLSLIMLGLGTLRPWNFFQDSHSQTAWTSPRMCPWSLLNWSGTSRP